MIEQFDWRIDKKSWTNRD